MNNWTKKITIIVSSVVMLVGVFALPSLTAAQGIPVSENGIASSYTVHILHFSKESFTNTGTRSNNSAHVINTSAPAAVIEDIAAKTNSNTEIAGSMVSSNAIVGSPVESSELSFTCTPPSPSKPTTPAAPPTGGSVPSTSASFSSPVPSSGDNPSGSLSFHDSGLLLGIHTHNIIFSGSYWFFIAFIGNILMMLLGGYLRLHSGRSPGTAYAYSK